MTECPPNKEGESETTIIIAPDRWGDAPRRHHYCVGLMIALMTLVLSGPISLRGASYALQLIFQLLFGDQARLPCANTGRLWIQRLGLYELTRPKEKATDWVWLADHTIQLDSVQCFLIVGCRLSDWERDRRPLTHQDLEVLLLEPGATWNGEVIRDQFLEVIQKTGVPRAILTDGGPNLKRGITLLREQYPRVTDSSDIAHKTALILKKTLTKDERWGEFLKKSSQSRKHCAKTDLAFLASPSLPDQARYMNIDGLLKWATNMQHFMQTSNDGTHVEPWRVNIEFSWLHDFVQPLAEWQRLLNIAETVLHYVRWEGYHARASQELEGHLAPLRGQAQGDRLIDQLTDFVREQSAAAGLGERLPGSTECLESLIGKGKRLEGQQSRRGFTRMILAMAAAVVKPVRDIIQTALETVKTRDVDAWAQEKLGPSVQARRRLAFNNAAGGTKTG